MLGVFEGPLSTLNTTLQYHYSTLKLGIVDVEKGLKMDLGQDLLDPLDRAEIEQVKFDQFRQLPVGWRWPTHSTCTFLHVLKQMAFFEMFTKIYLKCFMRY